MYLYQDCLEWWVELREHHRSVTLDNFVSDSPIVSKGHLVLLGLLRDLGPWIKGCIVGYNLKRKCLFSTLASSRSNFVWRPSSREKSNTPSRQGWVIHHFPAILSGISQNALQDSSWFNTQRQQDFSWVELRNYVRIFVRSSFTHFRGGSSIKEGALWILLDFVLDLSITLGASLFSGYVILWYCTCFCTSTYSPI